MKKIYIAFIFILISCLSAYADTAVTAGDMTVTSKLMTFFKNIYVARGGVKIVNGDTTMVADRGIYDQELELIKAIDNVVVTQPDTTLTSDYLEAYVKEDRILARGNPKVIRIIERAGKDKESGKQKTRKSRIILTCNEVEGFQKENRFLAKGDVKVIEVPYREGETEEEAAENEKTPTSDLRCEVLEMFSEEDKAIARNNVDVSTETMRATGDKAIYLNKENRMIIVGHAHAYQVSQDGGKEQVSELFANKIIHYPDEDRSIAVGNVHATVYPGGGKGKKKSKDKDKDKKKQKKDKDKAKDAEENDESEDDGDSESEDEE